MSRILLILALLTNCNAIAADPEPVLVVCEMNPWQTVIGSDSATKFVIYDNGSVIYQRVKRTVELPFSLRKIDDPAKVSQTLLGFDPAKLDDEYELSSGTDQISTTIWTPLKKIQIYGDWRKAPIPSGINNRDIKAMEEGERKMWEALPNEVRAFLARIEKEREREGDPWLPENIEVMLSPYEYAPDASIIWPAGWPDLKSRTTRKRDEDSYSVFLPSQSCPELSKFFSTRKEKGAVLINEKKMAISYRFPFPKEAAWMHR
jgi:hypothetical protein